MGEAVMLGTPSATCSCPPQSRWPQGGPSSAWTEQPSCSGGEGVGVGLWKVRMPRRLLGRLNVAGWQPLHNTRPLDEEEYGLGYAERHF